MKEPIKTVDYLARSPTRVRLLEELHHEDRLEKNELKNRIEASRTTVQRNLDALKQEGWIEDNNREYWITPNGKLVAEQFLRLLDAVSVAKKCDPLLEWLPDSIELDFHALIDAEVTVANQDDPYAPVNQHIELMCSAEKYRCILPAVGLQPLLVAEDCVVNQGNRQEIIVDETVAETLLSNSNYRHSIDRLLQTDRCEIYVSERQVPYYLGLSNDTVQIGVGDEKEVPQCLVESQARGVQEWAENTYTEFLDTADGITHPQATSERVNPDRSS
jgi:predicted transcriptional regulator